MRDENVDEVSARVAPFHGWGSRGSCKFHIFFLDSPKCSFAKSPGLIHFDASLRAESCDPSDMVNT